ncbi:MAG: glycerol dehydrogenase [bacterium]
MHIKAVFPGKYIQGEGVLNELPDLIKLLGSKGMILASKTVKDKVIPKFAPDLSSHSIPIELFHGECCEVELKRVNDIIESNGIDVIIGMGGGKTIDTAKIAADRASISVIVVPTIASSDAPCSGCAVTYTNDGIFEAVHYQKMNPQAVLVDLNVIAESPTRFLVSGMGDALATWFEARSCRLTQSMNECGGLSTKAGLILARLCYDTLLKCGKSALFANEDHEITPDFSNIVEANILLSGIGFESSGLAAAHSIHNGLTALDGTHAYYHGEKVAFGVLAGLHLTDAPVEELETVYSFCEEIGLPTTLDDIGLLDVTEDELMLVAEKSCIAGASIHHEAGEITPKRVFDAIIKANDFGENRKHHHDENCNH